MDDKNSNHNVQSDKNKRILMLRVRKAKKRDADRNIVRLYEECMDEAGIQTGDHVAIKGKEVTIGIAWPAYPNDKGKELVRMNKTIRDNAKVAIDDNVNLWLVHPQPAQEIMFECSDIQQTNPRFESFIKRKLNNHPITLNDIVVLPIGLSREFRLNVISMEPSGFCKVTRDTTIKLKLDDLISTVEGWHDEEGVKNKEIIWLPFPRELFVVFRQYLSSRPNSGFKSPYHFILHVLKEKASALFKEDEN